MSPLRVALAASLVANVALAVYVYELRASRSEAVAVAPPPLPPTVPAQPVPAAPDPAPAPVPKKREVARKPAPAPAPAAPPSPVPPDQTPLPPDVDEVPEDTTEVLDSEPQTKAWTQDELTETKEIDGWPGWVCQDFNDGRPESVWYTSTNGPGSATVYTGNCESWKNRQEGEAPE